MNENKIEGIVLKIINLDNDTALIKTLTSFDVVFLKCKFFLKNKNRFRILEGNLNIFEYLKKYSSLNKNIYFLKKTQIKDKLIFNSQQLFSSWYKKINLLFEFIDYKAINFYKTYLMFIELFKKEDDKLNNKILTTLLYALIKDYGIYFNLNSCVICNLRKNIYAFSSLRGGFICTKHNEKIFYNEFKNINLLKNFLLLDQKPLDYIFNVCEEQNSFLWDYLFSYLNKYKRPFI